jgi:hypothetical protein
MKLGHKGHLNTSNKFLMRFFSNPKIFFPHGLSLKLSREMLVLEVTKALMVSSYGECLFLQITPTFINNHHYCQKFFFICRELLIENAKTLAEIGNWVPFLSKHCSNASVKDQRRRPEGGGEWEPIKILMQKLGYVQSSNPKAKTLEESDEHTN